MYFDLLPEDLLKTVAQHAPYPTYVDVHSAFSDNARSLFLPPHLVFMDKDTEPSAWAPMIASYVIVFIVASMLLRRFWVAALTAIQDRPL